MRAAIYRGAAFVSSIACYGIFLLVFLYLLAFLANLQATPWADAVPALRALVPLSIDLGRDMGSMPAALLVNLGLTCAELNRDDEAARWLGRAAEEARAAYAGAKEIVIVRDEDANRSGVDPHVLSTELSPGRPGPHARRRRGGLR